MGCVCLDRLEDDVFHFAETLLCFADEADVVSAHLVLSGELDLYDGREREREDAFNAYAVRDFADGHGFGNTIAFDNNNDTFEDLNTLFFFTRWGDVFDFLVHANGHPCLNLRRGNNGGQGECIGHRSSVKNDGRIKEYAKNVKRQGYL